jgi:tRNA pseudouridine38-40 synthase
VQAVVEAALAEFTGETIRVTAAGRTDAGVHALGQLASFHTVGDIPEIGFRLGLQTKLPDDVAVVDAVEVPYGFSARYDTVRKTYRYVIQNSRLRTPWLRNYIGWHRAPLDERAMQAALDVLVGTHDFRSFETDWPNKATSVRTVLEATIWRSDHWDVWKAEGGSGKAEGTDPSTLNPQPSTFLCIDVTADGFLYNMMRAIVGTLIHVGRGNWTAEDVKTILAAQDRGTAGETAPAQGLYLLRCEYEVNPSRIAERIARPLPMADDGE